MSIERNENPTPLIVRLDFEDFKLRTMEDYKVLMIALGEAGLALAWEYPDYYPIFPTYVIDSSEG